jgi:hypothetical protein
VRYVTRERIHVDRIATAWAIRRFLDPHATFSFVPRTKDVRGVAETPFDVPGAELSHRGPRCTFEVLLETRGLSERGLARMGLIVRGADLPHEDGLPAESAGVRALFNALRDGERSDEERLDVGVQFCDALYAYCRTRHLGDSAGLRSR